MTTSLTSNEREALITFAKIVDTRCFKLSEFLNTSYQSLMYEQIRYLLNNPQLIPNLCKLASVLECIRGLYGLGIRITSGLRCPSLNEKVLGVPNSKHLKGLAVDITPAGTFNGDKWVKLQSSIKSILGEPDQHITCYWHVYPNKRFIHIQLDSFSL